MPSDSLSQLQTGAHARATNGGAAVSWQRMTHAVKLIDRDLTLLCVQRLLTIDQPLQLLLSGNRALRIASSKPSSRDAAMQQRCSWVVAMAAAWVLVAMQLAAPIAAAPTAAATGPAVESSYSIVRIGMSHQYFHVPAADAGHVWFDLLRLARLPAASLLPARRARHCGDLRLPPVLPVPAVRRLHSRSRAATCARTLAAGTLTTRSPGPPARLSRAAVSSECWQHELCACWASACPVGRQGSGMPLMGSDRLPFHRGRLIPTITASCTLDPGFPACSSMVLAPPTATTIKTGTAAAAHMASRFTAATRRAMRCCVPASTL